MQNVLSSAGHPIGRCPIDNKTAVRTLKTRWRQVLRKMPMFSFSAATSGLQYLCCYCFLSYTPRTADTTIDTLITKCRFEDALSAQNPEFFVTHEAILFWLCCRRLPSAR